MPAPATYRVPGHCPKCRALVTFTVSATAAAGDIQMWICPACEKSNGIELAKRVLAVELAE